MVVAASITQGVVSPTAAEVALEATTSSKAVVVAARAAGRPSHGLNLRTTCR